MVIQDRAPTICGLLSRKHQLLSIVLFSFQFSARSLAEPAKQRQCDVCSMSSDTVQIWADPSRLNKRESLGASRLTLLPLNSGVSLSLAGLDFVVNG